MFGQIKQEELEDFKSKLVFFEDQYKNYRILLKDKKGQVVNVCPKCQGVYKLVNYPRSSEKFLGCSNYPKCRSYGFMKKLKNLDFQWQS